VRKLHIPCGVVLNRVGVGNGKVGAYCHKENIPILLTIPLDTEIVIIYSRGIPLVKGMSEWRQSFLKLLGKIREAAVAGSR